MRVFGSFAAFPGSALGWIAAIVIGVFCLYMARLPAHRLILSLAQVLHHGLRLGASAIKRAERNLVLRNREVLLAAGREAAERTVEREFERVDASVKRDLSAVPTLFRSLSEQVTKIEEDHGKSKQVPPAAPGWVGAVKAVADVESKGDAMVAKILENIHTSLVHAEEQAIGAYRAATQQRHKHLESMTPHWRKATEALGKVEHKITSLLDRSKSVDRYMDEYKNINAKSDRAERMLSSSSIVQFFVSAFVLSVAVGGALINFQLIARPMAEMVGGSSYVAGFKTSDIAALVIILVEISMGLFLMESLRITRLFPVIGALADKTRVRMVYITLTILTLLASVEAGLAFMREVLMQDGLATSAALRGETGAHSGSASGWITTTAQMGMGFILPYALTFVAIPMETFVHSLRTVLGICLCGFLRALAVVMRVLGLGCRHVGRFMVDAYDVAIFAPLWIEGMVVKRSGGVRRSGGGPGRGLPPHGLPPHGVQPV